MINDFKVGETVKIKSWEQMCKEFKHCEDTIYCDASFINDMKHLCGRDIIVEKIERCDNYQIIQDIDGYQISFDMITYPDGYVVPNILEKFTTDELLAEIERRKRE